MWVVRVLSCPSKSAMVAISTWLALRSIALVWRLWRILHNRHTAAMRLLHAGVDTTVIALWLGHEQVETTQMYLHADLTLKERALAKTKPLDSKPGRYRPPDALLDFLDRL